MKKIVCSLLVAGGMSLMVGGCAHWSSSKEGGGALGGQVQATLVDVVSGMTAGKIQNSFRFGDMVYLYVTLDWEESGSSTQTLGVKWYDAIGKVVATKIHRPKYTKKPHHVWFWINSAQLGKGDVRVEILLDQQVLKIPFTVTEPLKNETPAPWYRSIFKTMSTGIQQSIIIGGDNV